MMKVAVVCLAYLENSSGIRALSRYFSRIGADLFVHVDAKASIKDYTNAAPMLPNLRFVEPRVEVWWGGFSLIRAVIAALQQARDTGNYDRYILLTEDTIPLVSPEEFGACMSSDIEFIRARPVPPDPTNMFRRRYEGWYLLDAPSSAARHVPLLAREVDENFLRKIDEIRGLRKRGKFPVQNMHSGSTWWALTKSCIEIILEKYATMHAFNKSLEFSAIPEEIYVQTLLANTSKLDNTKELMYVNMESNPKPYVYETFEQFVDLKKLPFLLARKVDLKSKDLDRYIGHILEAG